MTTVTRAGRHLRAVTTPVESVSLPAAESRIDEARRAALDAAHRSDRDEAVAYAEQALWSGTPLQALILDAWRAGFVAGHLDATSTEIPDPRPTLAAILHTDPFIGGTS